MSLIAFEHAIGIKNPIKRQIMASGSGGPIVHCEFILPTFGNIRASSWNDVGVDFKTEPIKPNEYIIFDIGSHDQTIYNYFNDRKKLGYDFKGLFTNLILKLSPNDKEKFFCSEICYDLLANVLGFNLPKAIPSQVSPNDLYLMLKSMNFQQVYLQ